METSTDIDALERARREAVPEPLRAALDSVPAYLVGGAVRDALLGVPVGDLDLALEGELDPVLDRLGVESHSHERFGTASVVIGERTVDLARTRHEHYPHPGALPEVSPAPIRSDLRRRDFTINAMAVPLAGPVELLDPHGGRDDLRAGVIRVLHEGSFGDDPTRALRAARYAARLGFRLEDRTAALVRKTDLNTVSADRVRADLLRIATEGEAVAAFGLLDEWGLVGLEAQRRSLLERVSELILVEPWIGLLDRGTTLLDVVTAPASRLEAARRLADQAQAPGADSDLYEAASGHDDGLLAIARALGAERLDRHVSEWRRLQLRITGDDLVAAGVAQGPAVGRALRAVMHARIDGAIDADRDAELRLALRAASGDD